MDLLVDVHTASTSLNISKAKLYRLPLETPGVYCLGKSKRFCIPELLQWAKRKQEVAEPVSA
jgi:hypothetical protein